MINQVIKRDGRTETFDRQKIYNAISKAGVVSEEVKEKIIENVENLEKDHISVEEIQDIVERELMDTPYKEIAKDYIRYRYRRELIRENEHLNNSVLEIVENKNEYVNEENSNKNATILSTQRDYMAGEISPHKETFIAP